MTKKFKEIRVMHDLPEGSKLPVMINIGPSSVHARVTINDLVDNNENVLESVHHSKRRSVIIYIKVHTATRWTIRHGLMLLWFTDLMNVTEEVTIHRPK